MMKLLFELNQNILEVFGVKHKICILVGVILFDASRTPHIGIFFM